MPSSAHVRRRPAFRTCICFQRVLRASCKPRCSGSPAPSTRGLPPKDDGFPPTLTSIPASDASQHSGRSCERCYFMHIDPRFDVFTTRCFSIAYLVHSFINTRSPGSTLTSRIHLFMTGTNQFADERRLENLALRLVPDILDFTLGDAILFLTRRNKPESKPAKV
jgi:hypothetical protein